MSSLFSVGEALAAAKLNAMDDRLIAVEALITPDNWVEPVLSGGFGNPIDGTSHNPGYRLDGYTVWLRGVLRAGSAISGATTIWTFPAGYRPDSGIIVKFAMIKNGTDVNFRFDVLDTGVFRFNAGSLSSGDQFLLDGRSFPL